MKGLKEFMNENDLNNGYVALKVAEKSKVKINRILGEIGIKNPIEDMHMTLMFDESKPNIKIDLYDVNYLAKVTDIALLGEEDSPWYAVVMKVKSDAIMKRFNTLMGLGYKHSYDEFIPHISLKYGPSTEEIKTIMKEKKWLIKEIGYILLGDEYTEPLSRPVV